VRVLVTGSGGLIGSEAVRFFLNSGNTVWGIDNNMRSRFFGSQGSVVNVIRSLSSLDSYTHLWIDITERDLVDKSFKEISPDVVIHCAAQPSHDKAADIPILDFDVNARGTIILLEAFRNYCNKDAVFIHMSTNKVYGDGPNKVPLVELESRWEYDDNLRGIGISEDFSIDNCLHSLFGASKVAADVIAQEYGKYFGLNVGIFRGGCLTGPQHAGVELHGFLSYIVKCAMSEKSYTVFGHGGKQVRDQIHSSDVIDVFNCFIENPKKGEVYNLGGGYDNSASILEVISMIEDISGKRLDYSMSNSHRAGDHICYYTNLSKIKNHFPNWKITRTLRDIISEMIRVQENER
jgi:CDP-paratose 2-epimerase